jgi:hypothetical protein
MPQQKAQMGEHDESALAVNEFASWSCALVCAMFQTVSNLTQGYRPCSEAIRSIVDSLSISLMPCYLACTDYSARPAQEMLHGGEKEESGKAHS